MTRTQPDARQVGGDFESGAAVKVQLDIDDAPFLQDEEEAASPAVTLEPMLPVPPSEEVAPPKKSKKKLLLFAGIGVLLVALGAAAATFFLFKPAPPPPTPGAPIVIVPTPTPVPPPPTEFTTTLAPFWIPLEGQGDKRHFLVASFSLGTENGLMHQEIGGKLVVLRDAIYYYLANKSYDFLDNPANTETIRKDLLGTVNNYLAQGDLKNLYFDSYLMK